MEPNRRPQKNESEVRRSFGDAYYFFSFRNPIFLIFSTELQFLLRYEFKILVQLCPAAEGGLETIILGSK